MSSGGSSGKTTVKNVPTKAASEIENLRLELERMLQPLRISAIKSFAQPSFAGPFGLKLPTEYESTALNMFADLADITKLKGEAQKTFEDISLPGLKGSLSAAGYGRSGYLGETISRRGQEIALPLLNTARSTQANLANVLLGLGNRELQPGLGMASQLPPLTGATTSTTSTNASQPFNPVSIIGPIASAIASYYFPPAGMAIGAGTRALTGGGQGGWNINQMIPNYSLGAESSLFNLE